MWSWFQLRFQLSISVPSASNKRVNNFSFISISRSKFKRLDFRGFYIMALQKDDEFVCAATVRIHGHKVAEMPLVATAFKYRRQGMCQVLVHELEKMLSQLHVERLVLPAISERSELWQSLFGFSEMSSAERLELLRFPFLGFQGTTMFQKILSKIIPRMEMRGKFAGAS
ncbi:Increased DNA methylation 1 [Vitis vinifera]|uniref:Increased DNA methylation 1 n=1 Tax=Vitis vinifera TaxID=29760 RepID=A0A438H360_VITVI|nr:Increased DNA methylation 1 [Vitis vinifera]